MFELHHFLQSGAIASIDPDTVLIGYGSAQWNTQAELDGTRPAFYFPDFFLQSQHEWLQFENWRAIAVTELKQQLEGCVGSRLTWHNPHQKQFFHAFEQLQYAFACSRLQKAVPYAFAHCPMQLSMPQLQASLKSALSYVQKCPYAYIYGFWHQSAGMLGVTPELLFECGVDDTLATMALAGTCAKGGDVDQFCTDPKQLREHRLAIDGICSSLQRFGKLSVDPMRVLELPTLRHLMTPISVQLSTKVDFSTIVRALHPTPALGAYPRETGWEWLKEYNSYLERGRFGAPAGMILPDKHLMRCVVAIRNVQWDQAGMHIGAGCGVIRESQCDEEWNEIGLKMQAIRELLSL